jgi:hypothetical protein
MACGCKKKVPIPTSDPSRIIFVENGEVKSMPKPPEPIPPVQQVEQIVDKLNTIQSH